VTNDIFGAPFASYPRANCTRVSIWD